jgi:hypothetical protein
VRTSDEGFGQPGGLVRGEEGRGVRGGCGVLIGAVLMAITREKSTGGVTPVTVSRNGERGRRLRKEGDDTRGPHGSEGREGRGYRFGVGRCWVVVGFWSWAERLPRVRFHIFLFFTSFLFCFLNSFTDFAKMLQNNLNHFQRFYRNHCKVLSQ